MPSSPASPDRSRCRGCRGAALRVMNDGRLLDFVCIRETHQTDPSSAVVSVDSGALMLCPRGETLGHVWRAAAAAPFIDERAIARMVATRGRVVRLALRPN